MADCEALKAVVPDCKTDLNTLSPAMPEGSLLWMTCPGTCKTECEAQPSCSVPEDPTDGAAMMKYAECLLKNCEDTAPALISANTGGAMADCEALKAVVPDCKT